MKASYDSDVIAWAQVQVNLLRSGKFSLLDIEHIAEEIEDVGKSEQRELASRMAVLLAHLLKWEYQPERRGSSWEETIRTQRERIERRISKTPSLNVSLIDADWQADAWDDAVDDVVNETWIARKVFPKSCPWSKEQIMSHEFYPD